MSDLARTHGVSEHTIYHWKSRFGGMEISEAKRLKELEAENAKLNQLYSNAMLDNAEVKALLIEG